MGDEKVLVIGIGNSGRSDDGLGWAFLDEVDSILPSNYDIEYRYQLQVEDAELASHYTKVVFIDAAKNCQEETFYWEPCLPVETHAFSSHELPPETILFLTSAIYGKKPEGHILGISGENFDLNIGMTDMAQHNLSDAVTFFKGLIGA